MQASRCACCEMICAQRALALAKQSLAEAYKLWLDRVCPYADMESEQQVSRASAHRSSSITWMLDAEQEHRLQALPGWAQEQTAVQQQYRCFQESSCIRSRITCSGALKAV